ncbi:MAG: hydrogenase 4 subunit D [Burkholderiaceae bacterium]|jgi:hydrogenase-4 component D|nr:hydrogenase 4 subunit D [Burkholderiaceae bacterium]
MDNIAFATILIPAAGAILVMFSPKMAGKWLGMLFSAIGAICAGALAYAFHADGRVAKTYEVLRFGNTVIFGITVDSISTLIGFAVILLGFLVVAYSSSYLTPLHREHPHEARPRYYAFLLIFIGAMAGLVYSSTLIGQLVFFEITGACSWGLISYYEDEKGIRGAMRALIITHIASLGLYVAAAFLFSATGTFSIEAIAQLDGNTKAVVLIGILLAAWGKSAQFPLHIWLPDAMEAPTPISAYLHAASMVKVGVFIFARAVMSAGGIPEWVAWTGIIMAMITMVFGFFMYLPQRDMKRLLAYSTITQLAYIFLALSLGALGSDMAFKGGIAHIFNHAFAKSLFFLLAGVFSYGLGTRMLPDIRGLLAKAPLLGICFCVGAMAIGGMPPFNLFFSKFTIFAGGVGLLHQHKGLIPLLIVALVESVAAFAWFLMWFGKAALGKPSPAVASAIPVPWGMQAVLIFLIIMSAASSFIAAAWLG